MPLEYCSVERDGRLTIVRLNRPEVMNALHSPAHFELASVFDDFARDPEQWVGIVTGAGAKAFCAGNDLKFQAGGGTLERPPSGFGGITSRFDLAKPLIAAVNGVAMGGRLRDCADLRPDRGLGERGVRAARASGRIGRPRRRPASSAQGDRHQARDGHDPHRPTGHGTRRLALGFVNEVVAPDELMPAARRWAGQILECSPMSVRASKEAACRGLGEGSVQAALEAQSSYPAVQALYRSKDRVEGPLAFSQKRAPNWTSE